MRPLRETAIGPNVRRSTNENPPHSRLIDALTEKSADRCDDFT